MRMKKFAKIVKLVIGLVATALAAGATFGYSP